MRRCSITAKEIASHRLQSLSAYAPMISRARCSSRSETRTVGRLAVSNHSPGNPSTELAEE